MPFRKIFFWCHLAVGLTVGTIVFVMSATGVLLTYERQLIAWSVSRYERAPEPGEKRRPVSELIESARSTRAETPTAITLEADPAAPVVVSFGRAGRTYLDPYSGEILGDGATRTRAVMAALRAWHRWLGAEGEGRAVGKAITGACNLGFLFLTVSGAYIWMPRVWNRRNVRAAAWFRGGLKGKARDFNWHNVIGVWSAVVLFWIVLGGVVISYSWALQLIYAATGEQPPSRAGGPPPRAEEAVGAEAWTGLDALIGRAEVEAPLRRTITLELPRFADAPVSFAIDEGNGARPDLKYRLTLDREARIIGREGYADQKRAQNIRGWLRFIHTGEAGGVIGQTLAGLVSAGATVLVWTGFALSWRRFRSWLDRRKRSAEETLDRAAAA